MKTASEMWKLTLASQEQKRKEKEEKDKKEQKAQEGKIAEMLSNLLLQAEEVARDGSKTTQMSYNLYDMGCTVYAVEELIRRLRLKGYKVTSHVLTGDDGEHIHEVAIDWGESPEKKKKKR